MDVLIMQISRLVPWEIQLAAGVNVPVLEWSIFGNDYSQKTTFLSGGAGLVSTARDYLRWGGGIKA
jgi:hypothetical protein